MNITVPEKSLCCNSNYLGGHELPGNLMKDGLRIFYKCGASLSVYKRGYYGEILLLTKNCCKNEQT